MSEIFLLNPKSIIDDDTEVGFIPMALVEDGFSGKHLFEKRTWKEVKKGYCHFQNGDIGVAKISPCFENLKSCILSCLPNNVGAGTTELVILRSCGVFAPFYLYLCKSDWYISQGTKYFKGVVGQQRVNKEIFTDLRVPLPPLVEQHRIVTEIERWFALIDQIEQGKTELQAIVNQTKNKILDLAIHGKLVPQDPNDEPAIELLRRINPTFTSCDNGHYPNLPNGWGICKMKQVTSITNGKSQKGVEAPNGIYPIYGSGGVIGRSNQYLCLGGSTIIGRKGTINNPIFVEEHFWNVDTAFGLKANDALLDKYLYYFCLSFDFSKLDKSTAMPSLTKTSIGDVLIPIPPYQEQKRIVSKIDMVFNTIDGIMENL